MSIKFHCQDLFCFSLRKHKINKLNYNIYNDDCKIIIIVINNNEDRKLKDDMNTLT